MTVATTISFVYYLFDAFVLDLVALVIALTAGGGIMTETERKPR